MHKKKLGRTIQQYTTKYQINSVRNWVYFGLSCTLIEKEMAKGKKICTKLPTTVVFLISIITIIITLATPSF